MIMKYVNTVEKKGYVRRPKWTTLKLIFHVCSYFM